MIYMAVLPSTGADNLSEARFENVDFDLKTSK